MLEVDNMLRGVWRLYVYLCQTFMTLQPKSCAVHLSESCNIDATWLNK